MIRRKQYLYCTDVIPRRTLYRRKLQERKEALEAKQRLQLKRSNYQTIPPEPCAVPINTNYDGNFSESQENDCAPSMGYSTDVASQMGTIATNNVVPRNDSGIGPASSSEDSNVESDAVSVSSASYSASSASSDSGSDIIECPSVIDEDEEDEGSAHPEDCSSADEQENRDELKGLLSTPLSDSTTTTEGDALLMCLALGLRHSLSWAAIVDVLDMINHLFGKEVVKSSKYFFLKYMETGQQNIVFHVYCPHCERYLGTREDIDAKDFRECLCGTLLKDINEASTYFISLSLGHQIRDLLKSKAFVEALGYRFTRKKINDEAYEDIFDGEVYKSMSGAGGILGEKFNLSYSFNLDGFPVGGKSGKQSCWPIYVQIQEVPPQMRSKYLLLAGIYVGKKDPNMKIFMFPFVEEANSLSSTGINWELNGKQINSKIIPLCACVDSPARAKILNMKQFNGYYGCSICHCVAEDTAKGLRYTIPLNGLHERTHEEILLNAAQAHANSRLVRVKSKRAVQGVKGLTPIHTMNYLDLVKGIRADTMHSKLIGNGKHHTSLFHESPGKCFYIGSDVRMNAISYRLLSIKPPSSIMRPPRSLQHITLWKATEWRSWVLFYGVVCLHGIIPDEYVVHFSMLSTALNIILQKSITPADLDKAHILVLRYVFLYQELFGKEAMVFNVHLLLHTKRDVECLGPAWTNTAFGFEGANKCMLQLKKGTSSIAKEMARKYIIFKSLPFLTEKYATSENSIKFCEKLSGRSLKLFQRIGGAVLKGLGRATILDPEEYNSLQRSNFALQREVLTYDKMIFHNISYCTSASTRSLKHDDSFICIRNETKGRIQKICSISNEAGQSVFLIVRELILSDEPLFRDDYGKHCPIKRMDMEGPLIVIRPDDIFTQCVAMFLDHGNFICDMPYGCYSES